jgi:transposase
MPRLKIEITESSEALKALMNQQKNPRFKERVQALYLLKSGLVQQEIELAAILARGTATIRRWLGTYKRSGLDALLTPSTGAGRPAAIPAAALEKLRIQLNDPKGFESYLHAQKWLKEECGLEVDYKTVHKTIKYRLGAKLKVPRPSNLQQQKEQVETFKKTFLAC